MIMCKGMNLLFTDQILFHGHTVHLTWFKFSIDESKDPPRECAKPSSLWYTTQNAFPPDN